jgi:hypothetical protein
MGTESIAYPYEIATRGRTMRRGTNPCQKASDGGRAIEPMPVPMDLAFCSVAGHCIQFLRFHVDMRQKVGYNAHIVWIHASIRIEKEAF